MYSDNKWRMLKVILQVAIQGRSLRYMTALFSDVVSWAYEIRAVAVCIHHSTIACINCFLPWYTVLLL